MIPDFVEDTLEDRECASFLSHVRTCKSCREELETSYLIVYALRYMDQDRSGALDIEKLLAEKLRHSERRLRRHQVTGVLLWVMILLLAVAIAAIVFLIFLPGLFPELPPPLQAVREFLYQFFFGRF